MQYGRVSAYVPQQRKKHKSKHTIHDLERVTVKSGLVRLVAVFYEEICKILTDHKRLPNFFIQEEENLRRRKWSEDIDTLSMEFSGRSGLSPKEIDYQ